MKLRSKILTLIGVIGLALGASAGSASAQQTNFLLFYGNVCHISQCINNTGGQETGGNAVQYWHWGGDGEPNNDWNVWEVGTVDCGQDQFPFYTTNSSLIALCNGFYKGDRVLKFAFAPHESGSGLCITGATVVADIISACDPAYTKESGQYFIYNPNDYLVDVEGTVASYNIGDNQTLWLGGCSPSTANGQELCSTTANREQWTLTATP